MPMPMPVLPAVPSTMTPPGRSVPRAIASRTIARAARSLTEPPGFMNSALPRIVQPVAADAARNLMSGVFPMDSMTVGLKGMLTSLRRAGTLGEAVGANKPARPPRRRLRHIGHDAAVILGFVRRRRDSPDVSKAFTPIGDRLATTF